MAQEIGRQLHVSDGIGVRSKYLHPLLFLSIYIYIYICIAEKLTRPKTDSAVAANVVRIYYASRFYVSDDVSYYFSILAISSLAETLAANLVLCIPFAPKAVLGLRQTKLYTGLTGYMTVKSNAATANQSDGYYSSSELRHLRKPREHWFMSSKLDTNETANDTVHDNVQESESQRRLRLSMTQVPE